jgi:hypothetical protein
LSANTVFPTTKEEQHLYEKLRNTRVVSEFYALASGSFIRRKFPRAGQIINGQIIKL